VLVIFGASGDLTRRKLLPAIYNLAQDDLLPENFAILGVARTAVDEADYRRQMQGHVASAEGDTFAGETWRRIGDRLHYIYGEFDDPGLFDSVSRQLDAIRAEHQIPKNVLFYFAIPPEAFGTVAGQLDRAGLTKQTDGWRRVVIEKPFGYDLAGARELNRQLSQGLEETQIYRIDHYLGKETVQNILAFRFANGIFEPIWNRRYVDHVQMTVAETGGIGQRGAYYDRAGALRDIVQNHMLQLLALV
jgi:glucose-6-phosphate 1-dehydrogenase